MTQLSCIVYVSSAVRLFSEEELTKILKDSQKNNLENQITGVLLYDDGVFFQYIEGPGDNLSKTYQKIKTSKQHYGAIKLIEKPIAARLFPEWHMGFFTPTKTELLELANRAWWQVAEQTKTQPHTNPEGLRLLETFCCNAHRQPLN